MTGAAAAGRRFSDGAAYERYMGRWSRAAGAVFLDWLALPPGLDWLDVGCGTGVFTELILDRAAPASVTGIDPAEAQIAYAARRPGAHRAAFRVADAQALPFAEGSFNVVVSALVTNFIPDLPRAAGEMARVARPGGTVAGYVWDLAGGRNPPAPILQALEEAGRAPPRTAGAEGARAEALRALLEAAGLAEVALRSIAVTVRFSGFEEYWDSQTPPYNPFGRLVRSLPEAERARLRETVAARLPADADGRIAHTAVANAVRGRVPRGRA